MDVGHSLPALTHVNSAVYLGVVISNNQSYASFFLGNRPMNTQIVDIEFVVIEDPSLAEVGGGLEVNSY